MLLLTDIPFAPSLLPSTVAAWTCPDEQPLTGVPGLTWYHWKSQQAPRSQSPNFFHSPCWSLTLVDGAVERLLVRQLRVETVLRVVGPSSVGVIVSTDLGPLVGEGLRASVGKTLQHHIIALGHVAFRPTHGHRRTCCNKAGNYKSRSSQKPEPVAKLRFTLKPGKGEPRRISSYLGQ